MTKQAKIPTFESALAELENIVASMEAGQLPLEQLLSAHKRGAELLQFCQQALQNAQQQVRMLEAGSLLNFSVDADAQGNTAKAGADDD
ncbi:MAG: exodeoxyribonuclease VII small subunit [Betaproteobacteria bacterium]|nr:exodeoxyribonuclease VII small subunit [Betaproteobacteria bacterium]